MGRSRGLGFSLRVLGGKLGAQWERERRDTLFLMGAVALAVLPHAVHLPAWCSVGFFALFAWRLGLVFSGRWLPRPSVRWVAAAACTGAVVAQYHTLFGRDAGVALLVLFLGLKLMEMRARRDVFVVIFLCFFVMLTGFFYSQSIWSAAINVAALVALLAAMLTMQFDQREAGIGRRFRIAGVLLAQALPVAAALFVLFPRISGPLWGLPDDAHAGRTGLSETMAPGQISQLARSEEVAFRVRFAGDAPPPALMYWRGPTLGAFDGRTWMPRRGDASPAPQPQARLPAAAGTGFRYQLTLEPHNRRWLFGLEVPAALPTGLGATLGRDFDLLAAAPVTERIRYDGLAHPSAQIGLNESALTLRHWVQLPAGFNRRTLGMAADWRAEALARGDEDPARLVERALQYFRAEPFRYTLNPPLLARDGVDDFLFETRAGFCEHYASAFVVLMRALDIPARVVTGYQGGEPNPAGDYWIVRQADAHAWAEVWLPGRGWVRVDPTAAVAPERIERGSASLRAGSQAGLAGLADVPLLRQWRFSIDSMTHAWNQWVLSYDRGRQQALLSRLGLDAADPAELVGLLAGLLALLTAAAALVTLRPRVPRDPVERDYDAFCQRLAAIGAVRDRHETASRYLHRVDRLLDPKAAALARDIVATYNRLRYDPFTATPEHARDLKRLVRAFNP